MTWWLLATGVLSAVGAVAVRVARAFGGGLFRDDVWAGLTDPLRVSTVRAREARDSLDDLVRRSDSLRMRLQHEAGDGHAPGTRRDQG